MQELNIPKAIYLYDEGIESFNFKKTKDFIEDNFGKIPVQRVKLKEKVAHTRGILFDFIGTNKAFAKLNYSKQKKSCHIILTQKLFATTDEFKRPHIRASIYSAPSIISISGIVEGPAKPKEYYLYKQKYTQLGIWDIKAPKIKRKLGSKFIDYQDKRLNAALMGYIAQALFFYISGEPFCPQKNCRLYNSHWQKELIYAQIKAGTFCRRHKGILRQIRNPKLT